LVSASESSHEPEQALYRCSNGETGDDIARPMSEEDDRRQDQTTAGGPDGVPLGWRQRGRRRCQRADIQWTL
jgi:hypothetical protein